MLQYWLFQNTLTGFTGTLVNEHAAEGLAKDRVIAKLNGPGGNPTKFQMLDSNAGNLVCTMTGTVTGNQLVLKITGFAVIPGQAIVQFKTKITGFKP